jgi:CHAT domain-containing protein
VIKGFAAIFLLHLFLQLNGRCPERAELEAAMEAGRPQSLHSLLSTAEGCQLPKDLLGDAFHRLGVLYYLDDDLEQAVDATRKAVQIRREALPPGDFNLGRSHHNLGVFYKNLERFQEAIPQFREAARIFETTQPDRAVDSRRELASVYGEIRDYATALDHIAIAAQLARKMNLPDLLAESLVDLGRILINSNQFEAAADSLQQAERIFQRLGMESREQLAGSEAAAYLNMAAALDGIGDFPQALSYYHQSLAIAQRLNDRELVVKNLNNIGITQKKLGNFTAAENSFRKALSLLEKETDQYLEAYCHDNLGNLALEQDAFRKSLEHYQQAIMAIVPGFKAPEIETIPTKEDILPVTRKSELLTCLLDKAEAWEAWSTHTGEPGYIQLALALYRLGDQTLDLMRFEHQSEISRFFWRKEARELYERALRLCFLLQDHAAAFYFMEKSKSILLLDALVAIDARRLIPEETAEKEAAFQKRVFQTAGALEAALHGGQTGGSEIVALRKAVVEAQYEYEAFLKDIRDQYPAYYNFRYSGEVPELAELQQKLKAGSVNMLHYFFGNADIYALRIGPQDANFVRIKRDGRLDGRLREFRGQFGNPAVIIDNPGHYARLAHQLYLSIYQPAWGAKKPEGQLLVIPDGEISFIPFDALLFEEPAPDALPGAFPYLVKKQSIRYAYSASVLAYQEKLAGRASAKGRLLFMAPFAEESEKQASLPFSRELLNVLRKKLRGTFLEGSAANSKFLKNEGDRYAAIDLSTHAYAGSPGRSPGIWLADTLLTLPELSAMSPAVQLVILSACETGLGEVREGEGVINLARGFAFSGASGLITSLWKVNDEATGRIFESFYEAVLSGDSSAEALRQAKLDYLGNSGLRQAKFSPYYWSGFVLWGHGDALGLESRTGFPWIYAILGVVIAGMVYLGVGYFMRRKD